MLTRRPYANLAALQRPRLNGSNHLRAIDATPSTKAYQINKKLSTPVKRLCMLTKRPYKGFACDKKEIINSNKKGTYSSCCPTTKHEGTPLSQIQGLSTSDDGQLTPVRAEVASGRAGERTPALGHSVLSGRREALCLPILRQGPLQIKL
ncbi:hypothetical protein BHE74_00047127 [Ensete ventricosum]|nr:hypothetical protein GW17_00038416 [Ensete ventricosum]RWW46922.1 hypothetical protein BHE74_00047127 [Ensete ventricosum]RZS21010.1 hypothetical protein BHM03_00053598 [Ensete ventricosum]